MEKLLLLLLLLLKTFPLMNVNFPSPYDEKNTRDAQVSQLSLSRFEIFLSQQFFLSQNRLRRRRRRQWWKTSSTLKIVVVCRWYPSEKKSQQQHQAKVHFYVPSVDIKHVLEGNCERARAKILKFLSSSADMRDDVKCKERKEVYWRKRRRCCYKYYWIVYSHT